MRMRILLALTLLPALAGANMLPPSMASSVQPRPALPGLAAASGEGVGLTLGARQIQRGGGGQGVELWRVTAQLDYQVASRLTAILSVPYAAARFSAPGSLLAYGALGDATALLRYAIQRGKRRELGLLAGVKLPTGSTELSRGGGLLPATQQPGSGTFDAVVGAAGFLPAGAASVYGALSLKLNSKLAYTFGHQLAADVGVNAPVSRRWSLTGEVNLEASERDRSLERGPTVRADGLVMNTGGQVVSLSPGAQWRPAARLALFASVQLPAYQNLHGQQLAARPSWQGGLQTRF